MNSLRYVWLFGVLGLLGVASQGYYGNQDMLSQIKIGGLFDDLDPIQQIVLKQAVDHLNHDYTILENYHLSVRTENIEPGNSFYTTKAVCSLMKEGIAAIIGPQTSESSSHTQAVCDRYDIPHIETKWDYKTRQDKYTINLFPHPDILGQAYSDLIDWLGWTEVVIIYDNEAGLIKLQTLIKNSLPAKRTIRYRPLPSGGDYRHTLKEIQRAIDLKNVIIDCDYRGTLEVLRQAQQIGMTYYLYKYVLTTLDIQEGDLDEFKHGDANFWTFRMVDPTQSEVIGIVNELNVAAYSQGPAHRQMQYDIDSSLIYNQEMQHRVKGLTVGQALVFDAVKLLGKALQMNPESIRRIRALECERQESWTEGSSIINDMRAMPPFQGLTGTIQFNNTGFRTDIALEVIKLQTDGLKKAGIWSYSRSTRFEWVKLPDEPLPVLSENEPFKMENREWKVISSKVDPFCMYKRSEESLDGNARFEGFAIDLVDAISKRLGFTYKIDLIGEKYAEFIERITSGEADIVAADLTITKDRQEKVDLTMPFMNIGVAILHTVPQAKPPSLFSFMSPFAIEVWMYVAFGFFGVSFVMFLTARITPYEWDSPFPCITEPEVLHNQFSLSNSFWFTIGSIMQQGSDLAPKAVSTRMVAGIWWFFTLIMVSSYTANLATFLIVQDMEESIKSLDDLANQNKITYGCKPNASTMGFFRDSKDPIKQKLWSNMVKNFERDMMENNKGVDNVIDSKGKYAFFMESSVLEYNMERRCGLRQVGSLLDNKGYGIALKKNSTYLNAFNGAILQLQENGKLDEMRRKWWKEERKESNCEAASVSDSVKPLQLANVGGVFVVLVGGCIIAVFVTIAEFFWKSREFPINEGESLRGEIIKDLQFALQCRGNVKPVKKTSLSSDGGDEDVGGSGDEMEYGWVIDKKE